MFSRYDRQGLIGTGTFGHVFLVRSKESGDLYAMKEMRLSSMSETEQLQALTEVKVLAKCRHANIIRYKEAAIQLQTDTLSIVMEYAECGNLHAAIKKQKGVLFEEGVVLNWFVQMTFALKYIHDHNILHRDLKTQNIFLTRQNVVKIGDFGIARMLKENKDLARTVVGTPYYLSPEICSRKPYSFKSDIWALGCVLYEMATLTHPFQARHFHELIQCITNGRYKELPRQCGNLIPELVWQLLHHNADERPSVDQILSLSCLQGYFKNYTKDFLYVQENDRVRQRRFSSPNIDNMSEANTSRQRRVSATEMEQDIARFRTSLTIGVDGDSREGDQAAEASFNSQRKMFDDSVSAIAATKHDIPTVHSSTRSSTLGEISRFRLTSFTEGPDGKWMEVQEMEAGQRNNDTDIGYQTGDPSCSDARSSGFAAQNVNDHSAVNLCSDPKHHHIAKAEPLHFQNTPRISETEDSDVPGLLSGQCQHGMQCDRCLHSILWKTRFRNNRMLNLANESNLRKLLEKAVGSELFSRIYGLLFEHYNSENDGCLKEMMNILHFDQRQYLPLFLQLMQLYFLRNSFSDDRNSNTQK